MNTVVCDWPTSDLADAIGPVMEIWLQSLPDWRDMQYVRGLRVFGSTGVNDGTWCISEFLTYWLEQRIDMDSWDMEVHEDCKWQ